jgi:GNAT superfamily N-acetyltransferase
MSWQNDPITPPAQPRAPAAPWDKDPIVGPTPRQVLSTAVTIKPDAMAEAERLAKRYPAPAEVIVQDLETYRLQEVLDLSDSDLQKAPMLRELMRRDVKLATMAQDDIPVLTKVGNFVGDLGGAMKAGVFRASRGAAGTFQAGLELVAPALDIFEPVDPLATSPGLLPRVPLPGGNPLRRLAEGFALQGQAAGQTAQAARPKTEGVIEGGFFSGIESLTQNLITLPAAFLPGGQGFALSGMTAFTGGDAYQQAREKGLAPSQALPFAASQAAIEYATEKLPLGALLKDVKAGAGFLQILGRQVLLEVPGEQIATVLQDLNEWAVLNPEKPFTSYLEERPSAAAQTLVATIVGTGGNVAVAKGLEAMISRATRDGANMQRAGLTAQALEQALKAAEASKLRERSPEQFRALMAEMAEDGSVYVDAEVLNQMPAELLQRMEGVAEALPEALLANAPVAVKLADVLTVTPGTPQAEVFMQNARSAPDAPSLVEAEEAGKQAQQFLQQEAQRVIAQAQDQEAMRASSEAVRQSILTDLNTAGRYRGQVNEGMASWASAFYTAYSARLGITPEEMYQRYRLRVLGQATGQGEVLNAQGGMALADVQAQWDAAGIRNAMFERDGLITLSQIIVPKDQRGQGVGTTAMQALLDYADRTGQRIALSPSADFGGNKKRLVEFYKRFGFVENKGRNKDFAVSETMIREPRQVFERAPAAPALDADTIDGLIADYGTQFTNRVEIERAFADGDLVFAAHEMMDEPAQVTTPEMLASYTPDQLYVVPRAQAAALLGQGGVLNQSVSTRLPTAKKATENPLEEMLVIGLDAAKADPKAFEKNAELIRQYPNFRDNKSANTADKAAEQFIRHVVDNLLWLYDQVPATTRERSKLWYDGARAIVDRWVPKYNVTDAQTAGMLAVLSPQKDWFQNVSLAERVLDIMSTKQDFAWSEEMSATAAGIGALNPEDVGEITGKKLGEIDSDYLQAMWVRVYDQTYNERGYRVVSPEGDFTDWVYNADGTTRSKTAWGSFVEIGKAISIFKDGSIANISANLGEQHKVRNFYNNIFNPASRHGDVTIDTHAVAAALLRPLSGSATEVLHNFGAGGAASSSVFGSKGTYGIYAEAYRRAADQRGVLPREMQSITWEAVRGLYTAGFKSQASNVARIDAIWENYKKRRISLDDARNQLLEAAGRINPPEWEGSGAGASQAPWASSYTGELRQGGGTDRAAGRGDRGLPADAAAGVLEQGADLTQWSGGAPIVDRAQAVNYPWRTGEAVVVQALHGTLATEDFDVFRPSRAEGQGKGIYFSTDPADMVEFSEGAGGRVIPVYVRLSNPYVDGDNAPAGVRDEERFFDDVDYRNAELQRLGFDGVIAPQGNNLQGTEVFVFTAQAGQIKSIFNRTPTNTPGMLEQGARGTFNPRTLELVLNPNADLSTWFHETGHFFLEVLADIASQPGAPAQIVEDMNAFLKWSGVPDLATWNGYTLDQKRPYHERWAESIEQYVMEGKAPNAELQPLMRRFRAWLINVYGSIKQFLAQRGVIAGDGQTLGQKATGLARVQQAAIRQSLYNEDPIAYHKAEVAKAEDALAEVGIEGLQRDGTLTLWGDDGEIASLSIYGETPADLPHQEKIEALRKAYADWSYGEMGYTPDDLVGADEDPLFQSDQPAGPQMALNDDIRRVMDRMLATDEQIQQANEVAGLVPDEQADGEAAERLQKRSMADLKWAVKARDKVIAKLKREAREIEKATRAEVTAEVDATPEMQAKRKLDEMRKSTPEYKAALKAWQEQRQAAKDAAAQTIRDSLLATEGQGLTGLKKGQFLAGKKREIENQAEAAALQWERDNAKPERAMAGSDADVAAVADAFGYETVDAMLAAIDAFGSRAEAIDALTERRMLEEHGDLIDERAIQEAANEAVHNEARARSLATELRTQQEMLGQRTDTGETNARGARITVNTLLEAARQFGANVVARTPLRDLKATAWKHTAAERRAGKRWQEHTAKGETADAVKAKQDQVLNNAAAKAALDAATEARKILEFFKRVVKGNDEKVVEKGRDPDIVNAARAVLAAYGIETPTTKAAAAYLEALQQNDPETAAVVGPMILQATQNAQPLEALTFEELQGLHEAVQAMWFLAKRSRQMEVDGDLMDIDEAADQLYTRMEEIGIPDTVPGETGALTKAELLKRAVLQQAPALLRRVEQWAEAKDGKFGGPFLRLIFQPIKDAADRYRAERLAYRQKFQGLVDNIAPMMPTTTIEAPELGYTFGRGHNGIGMAELLHAILHTGNESNKRKLLLGRGWATENPDGTLDTSRWDAFIQRLANSGVLQREHFDFAQGVWDLLEETKPLAQKTHRDVFGRYFAEVTADSFTDPFGVARRGGYVPAQADPLLVQDAELRDLLETENAGMSYAFPQTNRGFTKSRVEYNRPLKLDLRSLPQHIDKVLLFSHMESPVRAAARLIKRPKVSQPLGRIDPAAISGVLKPWLNRSARQTVETPISADAGLNRMMSTIRGRVGMALMFANISNTLQQITGVSSAAIKVKPSLMMRSLAEYMASPKKFSQAVWDASPYMADRASNEVAVLSDTLEKILINPSVYESAEQFTRRHSYFLQTAFDNVLSPIIWQAAYNQGLAEGMEERMAIRYADGVIRQTQGSTLPEDVSRIETGPAYARIFTQFVGYFNMLANTNATALKQIAQEQGLRKGAGKAFSVLMLGLMIPIWVAEAIALAFKGGPDDEDDDGYLDDWLAQVIGFGTIKGVLSGIPFVGALGQSVVNRFNDQPADDKFSLSPTVSVLESAAGAPASVYKAIVDDASAQKAVRDVAALVTVTTGLPAMTLARPVGYGAGVAQGRIEPTSAADAARGLVTGTASPESKQR